MFASDVADVANVADLRVHAMETPKEQLFYFKPDELLSLKLATQRGPQPPTAKAS
jgi:hypothetical protein